MTSVIAPPSQQSSSSPQSSAAPAAAPAAFANEPPLASFFTTLYDVHFEAPLKSVADTLYAISEATELHFLYRPDVEGSSENTTKQKHKIKIVPARLQTFKEKSYQPSGKKFGFVEFDIRSAEKVTELVDDDEGTTDDKEKKTEKTATTDEQKNSSSNIKNNNSDAMKKWNQTPEATADFVFSQIDSVLASLSSAATLGMKLKRVPEPVKKHLEESKLVTASKDPMKMISMISSRFQKLPASAQQTKEDKNTLFFFIDDVPIHVMMFLREELPVTFPKTATTESVEKFFVEHLGNTAEGSSSSLCLAKKDQGEDEKPDKKE